MDIDNKFKVQRVLSILEYYPVKKISFCKALRIFLRI
jgi:hypothetical protein